MPCPSCGTENPATQKFCGECGAKLAVAPAPDAGASIERKVVSVLFCDLVGFTSRSEGVDPEDVRATIDPYHRLLRTEIEAFGGTVEKFIGDAVMAVFGAPVAHEDDPERAVRAGLRILESLEALNEHRRHGPALAVRIGINTGEVVVSLDARPERGEGIVTGDVVNTAARIQTGAPVSAVAVGELTWRSTGDTFDYEALEPIAAKGKAAPVPLWRALTPKARLGTDVARTHASPLVGREDERELLADALRETAEEGSCRLVTITGEAGAGKSRMVAELAALADERPELITWRQGRCLPYGESIAFWALGEIVKAQAGILESDGLEEARGKLEGALRALGPGLEEGEHEWLRARLSPLVGASGTEGTSGEVSQEESFAAWTRFLEALAARGPAVYVFEDLHWADEAMLGFIEHVAAEPNRGPMLLVTTARPEFAPAHPGWAGAVPGAASIRLEPLSETDTTRLIEAILGQGALPAGVQAPILERAGGNPFYVEEFIRMLKDRGLLTKRGQSWEMAAGAEIPPPESLQGLIASRLDGLAPEHKALLQDASVLGKVFWDGALAEMGGRAADEVAEGLAELDAREFIRPAEASSMGGEGEYAFLHMLGRDGTYRQIPRTARAAKHVAAARWLEAKAGERAEDMADVLAHHWASATELAEAAGDDASEARDQAVRFLTLAGERGLELDAASAVAAFERALELADDHPGRPKILTGLGRGLSNLGEYARAEEPLREAIASQDPLQAAWAKVWLGSVLNYAGGQPEETSVLMGQAVTEMEELEPGPELLEAYGQSAIYFAQFDQNEEAIVWADRSLALAERLGLAPEPLTLTTRGLSRWLTGDRGGVEDVRRGLVLAREQAKMIAAAYCHNDLSNILGLSEGPAAALREIEAGGELARRTDVRRAVEELEATGFEHLYALGRWDELLAKAAWDDVMFSLRVTSRLFGCMILTWRGALAQAAEHAESFAEDVLPVDIPQYTVMALAAQAQLSLARGDAPGAADTLGQVRDYLEDHKLWNYAVWLSELCRLALMAGDAALAAWFAGRAGMGDTPLNEIAVTSAEAQLAEARGEFARAAELYAAAEEGWRTFSVPDLAQTLLGRGRCLLELGDPRAAAVLREAREMFASLEAERFLPDVDSHLERAIRRTS